MKQKKGFGDHQSQHGVTQKLQALIIARTGGYGFVAGGSLLASRSLVGQRAMGQRAHQQLGARKAMPQCGFQLG